MNEAGRPDKVPFEVLGFEPEPPRRLLGELCRSALRSMELNLTSLLAGIYTLSGWIKGQVTLKTFARPAQPKSKLIYLPIERPSASAPSARQA